MTRPRWPLFPLTVCLALTACSPGGGEGATRLSTPPPKTTALAVRTVRAQEGELTVVRTVAATLEAGRDSNVAAQAGGTVTRVLVAEGERVTTGQPVVQLDDTGARQALTSARLALQQAELSLRQAREAVQAARPALEAGVRAAELGLRRAREEARNAQKRYDDGQLPEAALLAAQAGEAQAESALAQARNALAQNGRAGAGSPEALELSVQSARAGVTQAETALERTVVRAPFAGVVVSVGTEVGEAVGQGSPVFRLVETGEVRARFNVTPADAAALAPGTRLNLDAGGQTYVAAVQRLSGVAGADRLVPVTARVEGGAALPVGGAAQVRYRAAVGGGVLVPSAALSVEGGESAVYVVGDGVARRVPVRVEAEARGQVAVRGLDAGARVVTPVPGGLQDGARVRVAGGGS
ncbi:efflux RND transporter periplasmic adaptor subunit [Deinococcus murrayi]|uniref:efflux RND transporter periplasmic adaptor subunit n=1 Tax=Deinococcus murrayi TaxID=68910 RepID=UPI00048919ED|nr:efflux RND transporter periplasmic adaptor subunit [Deinococcus murrayi]